ncbi:hypothetical protein KAH55_08025 [bacterium]|nr:hypothetical protein [bacterium]
MMSSGINLTETDITDTIDALIEKLGAENSRRIERGVKQAAGYWFAEDGSPADFKKFCIANYINDPRQLHQTFLRFENAFESIFGSFAEINRAMKWHLEVDSGPILPVDYLLGEFSPAAHAIEDLFSNKTAFVALLNFPVRTLDERLKSGMMWTREQWAQDRLTKTFAARVPGKIEQKIGQAFLAADNYIAGYNIHMDNVLTEAGESPFPAGLKLITHWGLRDELKAAYADSNGFLRQQLIAEIMEHIIDQTIPANVIDNSGVQWKPGSNTVFSDSVEVTFAAENNIRYQHLLNIFQAIRASDVYFPDGSTMIQRRFDDEREIPEEKIRSLFQQLLTSTEFKETGAVIAKRLGRDLKPFDIWYSGFRSQGHYSEAELDAIIGEKYPNVAALQADLVSILKKLGFSKQTAQFLANHVQVDPSRGAGHANEGGRRGDSAHLRTRIPEGGMTYKGYNIAVHEFGHNVEQVFSLEKMDYYLLRGVPNTAFTEAFAFLFQGRDLKLLGLDDSASKIHGDGVLGQLWATGEIAAVALVDMDVWHWLYEHPEASAAELKAAVIDIAKSVWNEYFAPIIGKTDSPLLAIYSHMIAYGLYLPDYPLGHIIDFQIESYLENKDLAREMERMCRIGNITPDQWMEEAIGTPISIFPLLTAARARLDAK